MTSHIERVRALSHEAVKQAELEEAEVSQAQARAMEKASEDLPTFCKNTLSRWVTTIGSDKNTLLFREFMGVLQTNCMDIGWENGTVLHRASVTMMRELLEQEGFTVLGGCEGQETLTATIKFSW